MSYIERLCGKALSVIVLALFVAAVVLIWPGWLLFKFASWVDRNREEAA